MNNYLSKRFPALSSRDYSIFLSTQFISNIGSHMQLVALNWHIYELTNSALALGLIGLCRFVPIIIFSLIGGSFADSHNRKRILYISQILLIATSLVLTYVTYAKIATPLIIYGLTIIATIALAFEMPARQAFIPSLIKNREHFINASSLGSISFQMAMIIGPTLSGFLIAHASLELIYLLNSISFIFFIVGLYFIKSTGEIEGNPVPVSLSAILEGFRFVRTKTMIWSTMLLDFFSTFFSSATALLPIFAKDILAVGPERLGLLFAAPSIGAVIAGLFIAHKHDLSRQGIILLSSVLLYAMGTIIFGFSKIYAVSFIALLIVGLGDSISTIIRNSIRQLETPDYIRGRMSSVNMIFFMGGPQLGEFEAGLLAQLRGAPFSVVTGGFATLAIVIFMGLKIPELRKYDKHQEIIEGSKNT
jgi:MFS family permease